ncbi:hypothetical protein [Vreelandella glaciei]|uniref:hypothetical protein n=1 Tax=Vreelandella glaciei TaxID=186761 RepID=UPI00300299B2
MQTQMIEVTPELANEWLKKNLHNRVLNKKRVEKYAQEMIEGKWMQSHQGVAFYVDGGFADGQHRLAAIIRSKKSIVMPVTWGVPREASIAIDSHQIRGTNQAIAISGVAPWIGKNEVAITKFLIRLFDQSISTTSAQTIVEYAEKNKDIVQFGAKCFSSHKPGITNAVVRASIGVCSRFEGTQEMQRFANILLSGMPETSEDKAAIVLREHLIRNAQLASVGESQRKILAAKVMRAAISFKRKELISRVSKSEKPPYQIDL